METNEKHPTFELGRRIKTLLTSRHFIKSGSFNNGSFMQYFFNSRSISPSSSNDIERKRHPLSTFNFENMIFI